MTDIAKLAASLTKGQRNALRTELFFGSVLRAELGAKGLVILTTKHGGITVALTPLGQQVRAYLKDHSNDA